MAGVVFPPAQLRHFSAHRRRVIRTNNRISLMTTVKIEFSDDEIATLKAKAPVHGLSLDDGWRSTTVDTLWRNSRNNAIPRRHCLQKIATGEALLVFEYSSEIAVPTAVTLQ